MWHEAESDAISAAVHNTAHLPMPMFAPVTMATLP